MLTKYLLKTSTTLNRVGAHSILSRTFADEPKTTTTPQMRKVVLFPGHGIGPEITQSVLEIFSALKIPIEWEYHEVSGKVLNEDGDLISAQTLGRIKELGYALKGPFTTPIGKVRLFLDPTT